MLKKITVAIALTGLMSGAAYAGIVAQTGINGSFHDMNAVAGTTDDSMKRTCAFCHTPHSAVDVNNAPLWNRAASTFDPGIYAWKTPANSAVATVTDPLVGPTRLCMSCHDGSIAYDSHLTAGATAGSVSFGAASARKISDFEATHPVGIVYADFAAARPGELVDPATGYITSPSADMLANSFDTKTRTGLTYSSKKIQDTLYSGAYMTCASCHDVHNTVNAKSDTGLTYNYFLLAREEGSAICLSCHIK
ncbi:MAG: cytochrome c3 family protein [Desulfuromonadaceae bacterium]|nr:cytochrome c3 family protein [Desulfuromonadaceae bacterium]